MNKAAIKKELRRSACEDKSPWDGVGDIAFNEACRWKTDRWNQFLGGLNNDALRTFFLLVAEAL